MSSEFSSVPLSGPWTCGFSVLLPEPMRSKSNFRRHNRGKSPTTAASSWESSRQFERSIALSILASRPDEWLLGTPEQALADRPTVAAFIAARSVVDVGNFPKSVLDACEGVLYVNDASVLSVLAQGARGHGDQILLAFAQSLSPVSPLKLHEMATELGRSALAAFPDAAI